MKRNEWETPCPKREDNQHCNCWYDDEECCACKDPACRLDERAEDDCAAGGEE